MHTLLLEELFHLLQDKKMSKILDAGSGRTSLRAISKAFPDVQVDAVVYPGDDRKLQSIEPLLTDKIQVLERDICQTSIEGKYSLVVAHLLLGEVEKFGNEFQDLLEKLLAIESQYFIIIDYVEDPVVDERMIGKVCEKNPYKIVKKIYRECSEPQVWPDFVGYHNFGYLVESI